MSFRFWPKLRVTVSGVKCAASCVLCTVCACVSVCVSPPLTFAVCRCTRVCGCAARRSSSTPPWRTLICCVARIGHGNAATELAASPRAIRAEFFFLVFAEKRNFLLLPAAGKRSSPLPIVSIRRWSNDIGHDGNVTPRHVSCVSSCAQPRTAMNLWSETSRVESELIKTPVKRTKGNVLVSKVVVWYIKYRNMCESRQVG